MLRQAYRHRQYGNQAVTAMLQGTDVQAMAAVTRHPAVVALVAKNFSVVLPSFEDADPLCNRHHQVLRHVAKIFARHVGTKLRDAPLAIDYYEGNLYGGQDPGAAMTTLPQVALCPQNAVLAVGVAP